MEKYYMIHKLGGNGMPTAIHPTLEVATAEAKRLAQLHIGFTFVIMESSIAYKVEPIEPTQIHFKG